MAKYGREKIKVTQEWFQNSCKPRITKRDKKIFRFIYENRLVTSEQIADMYFNQSKNPKKLCNSRLRVLYQLNCINKFYPVIPQGHGSSLAHICLDRAGAKVLSLPSFQRYTRLPFDYKHKIQVTHFRIIAQKLGWGWGNLETQIGKAISDICYIYNKEGKFFTNKNYNKNQLYNKEGIFSIEIDTGTENKKGLRRKAEHYGDSKRVELVIFISDNQARVNYFLDRLENCNHKAGCTKKNIKNLLNKIMLEYKKKKC